MSTEETSKCPKCSSEHISTEISVTEVYCEDDRVLIGGIWHEHDSNDMEELGTCLTCQYTWTKSLPQTCDLCDWTSFDSKHSNKD